MSAWNENPGSAAAIAAGCTCPVIDNNYGRGAGRDFSGRMEFWAREECPVHGLCRLCGEQIDGPFRCQGHVVLTDATPAP